MAKAAPKPIGYSPADFAKIRGESRAHVYVKLKRGDYRAVKNGHKTLIVAPDPYDISDLPEWKGGFSAAGKRDDL
jgi:hypothetical protein